jgi:hypothetical protein
MRTFFHDFDLFRRQAVEAGHALVEFHFPIPHSRQPLPNAFQAVMGSAMALGYCTTFRAMREVWSISPALSTHNAAT